MVGPSFSMLRSFFNAWRSITLGIRTACHMARPRCALGLQRRYWCGCAHRFPTSAIYHSVSPWDPDHVLATVKLRALCSVHKFPDFTRNLKAIIRFCRERQADILCDLTVQCFGANVRLITPRARFHILSGGAGVGECLSGRGLHVRILPSSFPPAVIPRQGGRSDGGPACATVSCES